MEEPLDEFTLQGMKVEHLKAHLARRGLSAHGKKLMLQARLRTAMNRENAAREREEAVAATGGGSGGGASASDSGSDSEN